MRKEERATAKAVRERFFNEFAVIHLEWMHRLVAAYKERGVYPVYPTQIADYYTDDADKLLALFSCFVMNWTNGNEREQIASMRQLIGEHPWQMFVDRSFVTLGIGRNQKNKIEGYEYAVWWKIAKVYDILWDYCSGGRTVRSPFDVLNKTKFDKFCAEADDFCRLPNIAFKKSIIELVLFTDDGIGRGIWKKNKRMPACPKPSGIHKFLAMWFPDWSSRLWTFEEAIRLFRFEHDYDFFYAYLAYNDLYEANPVACLRYATRFHTRWSRGHCYKPSEWRNGDVPQPEIKFNDY